MLCLPEPTNSSEGLIIGDTTGIDIEEVKPRVSKCYNPANACLVHRGMKETPYNPHFEELQAIRATKRQKINTGNMEYLEKKIHQGTADRIDYVPDSDFRTYYHDTQGYWTADRSTGQLHISDTVLNVQSALGASWDCATENGRKVAGRGYIESNHVADAGQEKELHDAHQLGFRLRAKRIPPIVVTPTATAPATPLLGPTNVHGDPLQPDDVHWSDFLVDGDAARADVVIRVDKQCIHGDWQLKGAAQAGNGTTSYSEINNRSNDGNNGDVQMTHVGAKVADTVQMELELKEQRLPATACSDDLQAPAESCKTLRHIESARLAERLPTCANFSMTRTENGSTGSETDHDSVIGQLRKEDLQIIQVGDFSVFIAPKKESISEVIPMEKMQDPAAIKRQQHSNSHQASPEMYNSHETRPGLSTNNTTDVHEEEMDVSNAITAAAGGN